MPQINYKIEIGPKNDMFGLVESGPDTPILTIDNKDSEFKTKEIHDSEGISFIKKIFKEVSSIRKTKITTNTLEVILSDVSDGEVYYFYKILKRKIPNTTILIDNKELEFEDGSFIYLNNSSAIVSYINPENEVAWRGEQEVLPVFIWENETNQSHIIDIDNKKYSFKREKEDIVISASKPNTHAIIKEGSIFGIKMDKDSYFSISPFIMNRVIEEESLKSFLEYDYSMVIPDERTIELEKKNINSSLSIELNNANIYKDTVVLYKKKDILNPINGDIDGVLDNYTVILDNSNREYDDIIFSKDGRINLINLEDLSLGSDIYVSYKYLRTNMFVGIDYPELSLKNKIIKIKVGPTKITTNGVSTSFSPKIFYSIEYPNGEVLYSEEKRTVFNKKPTRIDESFNEEDFYNNDNINSIINLKTLEELKVIDIGYIDLEVVIDNLYIHSYDEISETPLGIGRKKLYNYTNIAWHMSIDNTQSSLINRISIDKIVGFSTIYFNSKVIINDDTISIIEFDISKISNGVINTGELNENYLLNDSVSELANSIVDTFSNKIPSSIFNILNLKCYTFINQEFIEIPTQIFISNNIDSATIRINEVNETKYSNAGLGYSDGDLIIYPTILVDL